MPGPSVSGSPGRVLVLQRQAGNAAVASLLTTQRIPDCRPGWTPLVDPAKPSTDRCIDEDEPEFQRNYIDNNIHLATGLALPGTTWGNIDHDRVPTMKLTYKDRRTLLITVKDVPMTAGSGRFIDLSRVYEKRADGFIYPVSRRTGAGKIDFSATNNIVSLRAGLHDQIEELKKLMGLIELASGFAANIAALGGVAGSHGGNTGTRFSRIFGNKNAPAKAGPPKKAGKPVPTSAKPKGPYVNKNPKASKSEQEIGKMLHEKLPEKVSGAPTKSDGRSGDYRFEGPDGKIRSADLYEPTSGSTRNITDSIIRKSGQAEIVVVKFGDDKTAKFGVPEATTISNDVLRTPGHSITRTIFVKNNVIILDKSN